MLIEQSVSVLRHQTAVAVNVHRLMNDLLHQGHEATSLGIQQFSVVNIRSCLTLSDEENDVVYTAKDLLLASTIQLRLASTSSILLIVHIHKPMQV